jgi:hypothetical protein
MNTPWGSVGDGWASLVQPLIDLCEREGVAIAQIKEKFGALRFYVDGASPEVYAQIEAAETASRTICEVCGAAGRMRDGPWIRTLCDTHHAELATRRAL